MKAVSNMEELLVQAIPGQSGRRAGENRIYFGTVNIGIISGRVNEIVEMLTRQKVDLCCLQEAIWRGGSARLIKGIIPSISSFGVGISFGEVRIMLAEKWVSNVISVKTYHHRCFQLHFLVGTTILNVICCYAPQSGLSVEEKDTFYERVFSVVASVLEEEMLVLGGDFNEHVAEHSVEFEGVHGGSRYGMRNQDGLPILDFCVANKLAITNTFFRKNNIRLITFSSGGNHTQIDFILVRKVQLKNIKDTKVINSEECITQHKLRVCNLVVSRKPIKTFRIPQRKKTWKLKDTAMQKEFEQVVSMKC